MAYQRDAAHDIALEHCLWAKFQGLSPRTVIRSVGAPVLTREAPQWGDALSSVRAALFLMRHEERAI
ncbi:hypothetical protein Sp245p_26080 (plasmid) [Azospirillum baldaniorum]|uniref:Uncharacterized protein n=1 Tax=Azospirillum baldaniorum TaxID=1064539 RepID=A0A9P1JZX5_9PROT|nr:hypothetical protein [Azospirillum baldaniorum]AWJ93295.1 hypothetical protein Sp245p_26080 [Azospirillum baldaniorum]TWA77992.1 hypothetical protein FBZ85_106152 [Azospirillum brasilense]CCD02907.1 protein of unknown function [Azospirillum baldaniorum]